MLERLRRRPHGDLEPRAARRKVGRPLVPELGELELARANERLGRELGARDPTRAEHDATLPAVGDDVPDARLVHETEWVDDPLPALRVSRCVRDLHATRFLDGARHHREIGRGLAVVEPPRHVEMDERVVRHERLDVADFTRPVRGRQGAFETELSQRSGHAEDQQRIRLVDESAPSSGDR